MLLYFHEINQSLHRKQLFCAPAPCKQQQEHLPYTLHTVQYTVLQLYVVEAREGEKEWERRGLHCTIIVECSCVAVVIYLPIDGTARLVQFEGMVWRIWPQIEALMSSGWRLVQLALFAVPCTFAQCAEECQCPCDCHCHCQ